MTKTIVALAAVLSALLAAGAAQAQEKLTPPDLLVKQVTLEVVDLIAKDKEIRGGNRAKLIGLINDKVLPHFNFTSMAASSDESISVTSPRSTVRTPLGSWTATGSRPQSRIRPVPSRTELDPRKGITR